MKDVREILTIEEHEIQLSERATEIDIRIQNKEMREIVKALKDTIRENNLISLSAPAIGIDKRIFCINFGDSEIKTFINPLLANAKGIQLSRESDYCIPGKEYIRPRNNDIKVMYQSPDGSIQSRQMVGMTAFIFQKELDHLEGLLLSDIGLELVEDWDEYPEEERQEVINEYLDSLDMASKKFDEDEDVKEFKEGIDYMKKVTLGEIEVEYFNKNEE